MAAPILKRIVSSAGRILYFKNGRFVSKTTYNRERRRGEGGRFGSAMSTQAESSSKQIERFLTAQLGRPQGGGSWAALTERYPERFADYLADMNLL
jgi:hypothetical protein